MDRRLKKLWKRLHRDEGGNVIVLYIAAALLLVGMLWAVIGTGARMVQKETIQSSADAAAFSAAVIKAKGLNIIAFCNLVMAMLLERVVPGRDLGCGRDAYADSLVARWALDRNGRAGEGWSVGYLCGRSGWRLSARDHIGTVRRDHTFLVARWEVAVFCVGSHRTR